MPVEHARNILVANYCRPIRRGDLAEVPPGAVVAMIDGVFEQTLAVSPREVHEAVERGVVVFGGGSMGALRAAEVPGVIGVGRVFEWYRDGVITRDDEVAILFAEYSDHALTVPSVNVRFAVERLCRMGTINSTTGNALVVAALSIPYKERTYRSILERAGILGRSDSHDLIAMLEAHDLKYRDAQAVLEAVDRHLHDRDKVDSNSDSSLKSQNIKVDGRGTAHARSMSLPTEVLIWESGDCITHADLFEFLVYSGQMEPRARVLRANSADRNLMSNLPGPTSNEVQAVFNSAARQWGWISSEEAKVTLSDLGIDVRDLDMSCREEASARDETGHFVREGGYDFRRALLGHLFLDGLSLKRETMRLGSLRVLAELFEGDINAEDMKDAEAVICKLNREFNFVAVRQHWARLGSTDEAAQNAFVYLLARARRVGSELIRQMTRAEEINAGSLSRLDACDFKTCPKPIGESRFCLPLPDAEKQARRIAQTIGITRISMIGELGDLGGIQVAQAARPGNAWSSSYGSGKSRTVMGAVVGSIMEETEKWAQEQFQPSANLVLASFEEVRSNEQFVDPATLDLPYDSVYQPGMLLHWYPCLDLLSCRTAYLPVDLLEMNCRKDDICFTRRGARKHLATNGLGSGFSREEATLHGLCEYVERHAQRIAELRLTNPGGLGSPPYSFIDLSTVPHEVQALVEQLQARGATIRVLDITSEIRIPTFLATITRDLQVADGYGTHPDPDTAIEMALLEAGQSIASAIAGGREDLSIHARSLGRHERPRPFNADDAWFWLDPDALRKPLSEVAGLKSSDVFADLRWSVDRLRHAGVRNAVVADLTPAGCDPIAVMRVVVPGLETNNPFYTGLRARVALIHDLLPKWR
jgi:ribosomal protein S12 methylthiotransferase accessory factor